MIELTWTQRIRDKLRIPEKYIISFRSPAKMKWDIFVIFFAFVNCTVTPLKLAFRIEFLESTGIRGLQIAIEILFMIDFVVSMLTSYFSYGKEITDSLLIVKRYIFTK
jgi:hypothetical protein